jgi:hypothetical protein
MGSKKLYIGKGTATFVDKETQEVRIFKSGRTYWINDHIVHPMNRNSFDGIIDEIGVRAGKRVEKWDWIEFGRDYDKLEFRKYKSP